MKHRITAGSHADACYFRTTATPPHRKALVQITERCNLFCAHCFVSAGDFGDSIPLAPFRDVLLPQLVESRVVSVTLTGGEPFVHKDLLEIVQLLRVHNLAVSVCSNATLISPEQMDYLADLGGVQVNVSLDGFRRESHGKFRGSQASFDVTISNIRELAKRKLLKGLLATPNALAAIEEYAEICEFGRSLGAKYVLMNPLSSMGRGVRSQDLLRAKTAAMEALFATTDRYGTEQFEVVHIRFPNIKRPLTSCEAGNIFYVFTNGDVAICPYLVFAARTPQSKHAADEFMVGNVFRDTDLARRLDDFRFHERYPMGENSTCRTCQMGDTCGKGCPAAVVARGQRIGAVDAEVCPIVAIADEAGRRA